MQKNASISDFRKHIAQVYGGMFAGILFMASLASCFSLATTLADLSEFLLVCVSSAVLMLVASQYE